MFFVFDIPPGAKIELAIPRAPSDLSWIGAEPVFADGQTIPYDGVNFSLRNELGVPLEYCLWIKESAMRIGSPALDGFNSDGTAAKPNVPKVVSCDSTTPDP